MTGYEEYTRITIISNKPNVSEGIHSFDKAGHQLPHSNKLRSAVESVLVELGIAVYGITVMGSSVTLTLPSKRVREFLNGMQNERSGVGSLDYSTDKMGPMTSESAY